MNTLKIRRLESELDYIITNMICNECELDEEMVEIYKYLKEFAETRLKKLED